VGRSSRRVEAKVNLCQADIKAVIKAKLVMTRLLAGKLMRRVEGPKSAAWKSSFVKGGIIPQKGVSSGGSTTTQSERISKSSYYRCLRRKHQLSAWKSEPPKKKGVMTREEARCFGFVNFQP